MTEQLRELLEHTAGPVDSQPDVSGAWKRGRRLRRRKQLAVTSSITAVVLVGALAAIVATNHTTNPSPNIATKPSTPTSVVATTTPPTTARSSTPTTKAPANVTPTTKPGAPVDISGLSISDMSWINPTQGFALGITTSCITASRCPQILMKTTDGGAHWAGVATAKSPTGCAFGCAAPDQTTNETNIRFATEQIGYAFGSTGQPFMMTTDGGATWVAQPGPEVAALAIEGTNVTRVSYSHTGCPGPCDWGIETATAGSTTWTPRSFPTPADNDSAQLVRSGADDAYVAFYANPAGGAGTATADVIVSHDGGHMWTSAGEPCATHTQVEIDSRQIAAAPGGVVASLCQPRGAYGPEFVEISRDGGKTFTKTPTLPDNVFGDTLALNASAEPFVGTVGGDLAGADGARLYTLRPGRTTWTVVAKENVPRNAPTRPSRDDLLGFTTPTNGYWVGFDQQVWTTTDGGATWAPHAIG